MLGLGSDATKVQDIINQACQRALKRKRPSSGKWQSLEDRLLDCYIESCEGAPKDKRFCHGVHLLEKVVLQDNLSTLIVNLYPNNEGYSLMLKGKNGSESETVKLPYEEAEFLDYLDAQELPPILVDLLEKSQANIFYSGCVIVEVRDYRQTFNSSSYDTKYVLLKPTYQSLVCDVNNLTSDPAWSVDDKLALEAQLLLATEGPLCLDPSPEVGLVANQLQFNQKKFNTPALRSCLRSNSHAFQTRMAVTSAAPAPSSLKLLDFMSRYKKPQPPVNLRLAKTPQTTDTWKQKPIHLGVPSRLDVDLYAKMIERPKITSDNSPETVQEITLEGEKTNNRNYYCKVTIRRRPTDLQYLGELYLEEDTGGNAGQGRSKEDTATRGGKACQFFLGSKLSAQKYLQQFQDLYTEEGRKSVKICSYTPGQHSTQGTPASNNATSSRPITPQATQDSSGHSDVIMKGVAEENGRSTPSSSQGAITSFVVASGTAASQAVPSLSSLPTYGQKLAAFQQQQGAVTHVVTVNNIASSAAASASNARTTHATNRKGSFVTTSSPVHVSTGKPVAGHPSSIKTQPSVLIRRQTSMDQSNAGTARQSPTTPTGVYPGVVGTYMQSVVGCGSSVTLPMTMTVAGNTPIVSVNNGGNTITAGSLQAQFIAAGIKATGQPIQPAPPTPLTLLQGTTAIQSQAQLAQGRQPTTTFTLPGNLVPISQIPSIGGVATLNAAQIQAKTSPQTTPTGQPTHILPNTPMSPQSGMTTVTINARPILPQQPQGQQQRKISAGRTLINRGGTSTIQPLVPLGGQLAPAGSQLQQQQFQVRIPVQFAQQQLQQTGQAQLQPSGQTLVQPQPIQIQAQSIAQSQLLQPQVQLQVKSATQHGVGSGKGKSPGQRRRSQNK